MPPWPTVQCKLKLCIHWTIWSRCVATKMWQIQEQMACFLLESLSCWSDVCAWHHPPPESSAHEHQTQQMKFTNKTTAQPQSSQRCGQSNSPQAERKLLVLGLEEIGNGEAATSQEVPLKRKKQENVVTTWTQTSSNCRACDKRIQRLSDYTFH